MEEFRTLNCQLWLSQDLEEIWNFHRDPHNLLKITPDFLKLELVDVPTTIGKGSTFQITTDNKYLRPFFNWSVEYIDWFEDEDYKFFVDTQRNGPFFHWRHKHEFKRGNDTVTVNEKAFHPKHRGTWIIDSVEYSLKPQFRRLEWAAEKMVTQLFVVRKRRLDRLFNHKGI